MPAFIPARGAFSKALNAGIRRASMTPGCGNCHFYRDNKCKRLPESLDKAINDWCGEHEWSENA